MAHIDEHAKKFMKDVSANSMPPEEHAQSVLDPIRTARFMSKIMTNPEKAIGKYLIAKATKELTKDPEFPKQSSIDIVGIFGFMNDHFKRDWWDWEPETIWKSLKDSHIIEEAPDSLRGALMALQVLVKTNAPFEDWHIFEKVGHAFNMNVVNFGVLQPLEIDEAALTMAIMNRIRPQQEYEDEVLIYIAACAREAGMVYLPEAMFPKVQPHLDNLNFDMTLRDSVKNLWDKSAGISNNASDAEEIQLERLREVASYLKSGGFGA